MKAYLILEDGNVFEGESVGANKEVVSEFVFNTSMTGYVEVLTDPSYAGQSVVMTYPLIGNYGVCLEDQESTKPYVEGFVLCSAASIRYHGCFPHSLSVCNSRRSLRRSLPVPCAICIPWRHGPVHGTGRNR